MCGWSLRGSATSRRRSPEAATPSLRRSEAIHLTTQRKLDCSLSLLAITEDSTVGWAKARTRRAHLSRIALARVGSFVAVAPRNNGRQHRRVGKGANAPCPPVPHSTREGGQLSLCPPYNSFSS